jgi:O-antigen ligase
MSGFVWFASPHLRGRIERISMEYDEYRETNRPTSTGQRISYWTKSLEWIGEAPLMGHGTGSTKRLFETEAAGKAGAWATRSATLITRPFTSRFNGVFWDAFSSSMWLAHYAMFTSISLIAWIGAAVVTQNVICSLLNSHLFDFHEGWIYVLGVGVAGGMLRNEGRGTSALLSK